MKLSLIHEENIKQNDAGDIQQHCITWHYVVQS